MSLIYMLPHDHSDEKKRRYILCWWRYGIAKFSIQSPNRDTHFTTWNIQSPTTKHRKVETQTTVTSHNSVGHSCKYNSIIYFMYYHAGVCFVIPCCQYINLHSRNVPATKLQTPTVISLPSPSSCPHLFVTPYHILIDHVLFSQLIFYDDLLFFII